MGAKNFDVKLKKFRRAVNELKGMLQLNQKEIGQKLGYSSESAFSQVMNGKVPVSPGISRKMTFECQILTDTDKTRDCIVFALKQIDIET